MSSTDEEKARLVLDIFRHFDTEPGEQLAAGNLLSIAAMNGWQTTGRRAFAMASRWAGSRTGRTER